MEAAIKYKARILIWGILAFLIPLLFFLGCSQVFAATIEIGESSQDVTSDVLVAHSSHLHDSPPVQDWVPENRKQIEQRYTSDFLWLKGSLRNSTNSALRRVFYLTTPLTGEVHFWWKGKSGVTKEMLSGSSVPMKSRSYPHRLTVFPIEVPAGENVEFVLRLLTHHALATRLVLSTEQELQASENSARLASVFYLGGICCLVLFNLLLGLYQLESGYFQYGLFAGIFAATAMVVAGYFDAYLLPLDSLSFSHYLICFSATTSIAGLIFAFRFLNLRHFVPGSRWLFWSIVVINATTFLEGLASGQNEYQWFFGNLQDLSVVVELIFLIGAAIFAFRRGQKLALFFLLSWVFLLLAFGIWFSMMFGLVRSNFWTTNVLLFGNLVEMLVLSLGLAYKINILDRARKDAEKEARDKNRYHNLVRVLAHDVANGLSLLAGQTRRLERSLVGGPDMKTVDRMNHTLGTLKDVLNFVRAEEVLHSYQATAPMQKISLQEATQEVLLSFDEKITEKRLRIEVQVPADLMINADRTVFCNQILGNLVSNAIKFNHLGGLIELTGQQEGASVLFTVRDTGTGILPEQLEMIQNAKQVTSVAGTSREKGSGIGYWIVREYLRVFGACFEISSKHESKSSNSGTEVRLIFPKVTGV